MDRRLQLKPNTEYYIKARFKPDEVKKKYKANWSEWSKSINWTNKAEEGKMNFFHSYIKCFSS